MAVGGAWNWVGGTKDYVKGLGVGGGRSVDYFELGVLLCVVSGRGGLLGYGLLGRVVLYDVFWGRWMGIGNVLGFWLWGVCRSDVELGA